jgi:hypothetical protein
MGILMRTALGRRYRVKSSLAAVIVALCVVGCGVDRGNEVPVAESHELRSEAYFGKRVDVFGVPVHATVNAPDAKVLHAAGVLAQYLDNDGDGSPDDPYLVETMRRNDGRLFMAVDRDELDEIFEQIDRDHPGSLAKTAWWIGPEGITPADSVWQDLQAEETVLTGGDGGEFDGALEEVLHLITHVGHANAYPEAFAEAPGSRIAAAMDVARGGRFPGVPDQYPVEAHYTYYDETCVYQCQVTEYLYWALTSLMGGQDAPGRLDEIGDEWRLNTPEKLAAGNPEVYALLTDPEFNMPTVLPDGDYTAAPLTIVTTAANE